MGLVIGLIVAVVFFSFSAFAYFSLFEYAEIDRFERVARGFSDEAIRQRIERGLCAKDSLLRYRALDLIRRFHAAGIISDHDAMDFEAAVNCPASERKPYRKPVVGRENADWLLFIVLPWDAPEAFNRADDDLKRACVKFEMDRAWHWWWYYPAYWLHYG